LTTQNDEYGTLHPNEHNPDREVYCRQLFLIEVLTTGRNSNKQTIAQNPVWQ
jgi:hypothetical protein